MSQESNQTINISALAFKIFSGLLIISGPEGLLSLFLPSNNLLGVNKSKFSRSAETLILAVGKLLILLTIWSPKDSYCNIDYLLFCKFVLIDC